MGTSRRPILHLSSGFDFTPSLVSQVRKCGHVRFCSAALMTSSWKKRELSFPQRITSAPISVQGLESGYLPRPSGSRSRPCYVTHAGPMSISPGTFTSLPGKEKISFHFGNRLVGYDLGYRCPSLPPLEQRRPKNQASIMCLLRLASALHEATSVTALDTSRGAPDVGRSDYGHCLYSGGPCCHPPHLDSPHPG